MANAKKFLAVWIRAVRPFSFTASVTPVLIGAAWASRSGYPVVWFLFPVFLFCALLLHAATNLTSDYSDFKKGVDRADTFGSVRVLVRGELKAEEIRKGALFLFAVAFILGLVIVAVRGWGLLVLGLAGIAGGIFYTVSPVGYKYHALGDAGVFLFMGVLLVAGSSWALTGVFSGSSVLISLPISFLVTAILYANNTRDIKGDKDTGVVTLAGRMGFCWARRLYSLLILAAYVSVVGLVLLRVTSFWVLVVLAAWPMAWRNINKMRRASEQEPQRIATLDAETAQTHLVFGLLFVAALAWGP